ncbi:carbonic anhydrase [Limnohabitans sp. B9-3]|uniref:carbonic anhydrase n=1 Tax=Limnohabitans sp. B9-3 TaxID=1100707 RepID=UPI0013042D02|nr:carbonic anhydrase family protein [Limnohabitans sp. B9-3]
MKKYLRLVLEIVLGLLLAGAAAFAYVSYSAKAHVVQELSEASEGMGEAKEELEKLTKELEEAKEHLKEMEPPLAEFASVKDAFSNGVVLEEYDAYIKAQKGPMTSERQLGLAALRLLTNGVKDPDTISAFEKSLEMAEVASRLKTICAAQNALVAAGKNVKVLADCAVSKAPAHGKKDSHHAVHWAYDGEMGPEKWGDEFPTCAKGSKQSPLNITGPFEKSKDVLTVAYKEGPLKILNNGHTIQVNVEPGSTLKINKDVYNLLQFHFHRPSEEQIDGKPMAMVAHFVHKSAEGKLAVLGVLLNEGKDNAAIQTLWNNAPMSEGPEVKPEKATFDPAKLVPAALTHYSYEGSLTTPPCTEGVNFYILKTPVDIGKKQVIDFPFKRNARPVQPLNGRKINAN